MSYLNKRKKRKKKRKRMDFRATVMMQDEYEKKDREDYQNGCIAQTKQITQ
jgi:hypothetical protein